MCDNNGDKMKEPLLSMNAVIICLLVYNPCEVCGHTITDVKDLKAYLFSTGNYDRYIRPVLNQTMSTTIYIDYFMARMGGVDSVTQHFRTAGYLKVRWSDTQLTWNPTDYGGLRTLYVSQDAVWKPELTLKNGFSALSELGSSFLQVKIDNHGNIEWSPYEVFESQCPVDITYYPFDTQTCSLEFVSWSTDINEVLLQKGKHGIVLSNYHPNVEWDITGLSTSQNMDGNVLGFFVNITIKRKPMFFIVNMVLPIVLLAFLILFTFVLPADYGVKITYAMTVFLALAVFLTIVSASLPVNSQSISIISIYLVYNLAQGSLIIILAGVQIRIITWDGAKRVPGCLVSLFNVVRCLRCHKSQCCSSISMKHTHKSEVYKMNNVQNDKNANLIESVPVDSINAKHDKHPVQNPAQNTDHITYTWKEIAMALDVLFFVFFFLSLLISTVVVILITFH